jgi:tRNA A-37 threonylcarbamoyl transferase component Bud32
MTKDDESQTQPEYEPPIESPPPPQAGEPMGPTNPGFDPRITLSRNKTARVQRAGMLDGRYEMRGLLSQGGMARVFTALHRDLGRSFAVKLVRDNFKDDPGMRAQFFTEARLASSLSHPNIIAVTDYGIDSELGCYLVMELLEGETLRSRTTRQRLSPRMACDILDQAVGAVRYIHGRGIVHCDLKPENMFLARVAGEPRRGNTLKLLDFGLSWRSESMPDPTLGGTPPYLAPERLKGEAPKPINDVYSLGVILYELIAGRWPFTGTLSQIIDQQLSGSKPPPPSQFCEEKLEGRTDELVMRALERDPKNRQPTAEALHFELRALMRMMGMKMRRYTLVSETGLATLGGEPVAEALVESPIPLAIFERSGAVRFCNRSFAEHLEGTADAPLPPWDDLKVVKQSAELRQALALAIATGKPVRRMLMAGSAEAPHMQILVLHPLMTDERVDSVHATLIDTLLQ